MQFSVPVPSSQFPVPRTSQLVTSQKAGLETGNWRLETGNWKLETGN
jgi:hypothetical protein